MSKPYELREQSLEDLESLARERSEELMQLRLRLKVHQVNDPLSVRMARRELARIKTLIGEKKRAAER
jgi:large subunit ribosomal protein L29